MKKIGLWFKKNTLGVAVSGILAVAAFFLAKLVPYGLISGGVFALIIGMLLNPLFSKKDALFKGGFNFSSKFLLKTAIVFMGVTLSFTQVLQVGKFSLIVMCFTLVAAFGFGYLFGRLFKMNWKLSSLISAGTGICGGSAIAAISPVIDAKDSDIAYAISATFIFDILMVILFPIVARALGMSDMGFGLWAGTAINDTSSVVAAGYAFSDAAGNFAVIVKLTRTLSIVPIVIIFSVINTKIKKRELAARFNPAPVTASTNNDTSNIVLTHNTANDLAQLTNSDSIVNNVDVLNISDNALDNSNSNGNVSNADKTYNSDSITKTLDQPNSLELEQVPKSKLNIKKIFPYFILLFLAMVAIKSTGILPQSVCDVISDISKFVMIMALGAIGLKTNFRALAKSGLKPMIHGFIISALVVFVAFGVQAMLGQL